MYFVYELFGLFFNSRFICFIFGLFEERDECCVVSFFESIFFFVISSFLSSGSSIMGIVSNFLRLLVRSSSEVDFVMGDFGILIVVLGVNFLVG